MTVLRLVILLAPIAFALPMAVRASLFLRSSRDDQRKPIYIERRDRA